MTVHELPLAIIWLTKQQAAARANLSVRTIERAMGAGELDYSGGGPRNYKVRIHIDRLDEWLARRGKDVDDGG
jgi:Helix-turn-helix domain